MTARHAREGAIPEAVVFVLAVIAFSLMCAPGVAWMDSGELTAAAYNLGGAHPPGQPAHTLLGKLATLLPVGEIAFRVNLLSAMSMALAAAGVVALARAMLPGEITAALVAGGLVIASPVAQVNATRAEVYGPTAALVIWALVATLRFTRADGDPPARLLLGAALACGLAAAFHPVIALAATVPMATVLCVRAGTRLRRLAGPAIGLGLLGLFCYAYLPIRANAGDAPVLMWDDPSSAEGFWRLVRAPAFQGNFGLEGAGARMPALLLITGEGMGLSLLLGGLIGLAFGALTGLRPTRLVLATALAVVLAAATQRAFNPDMPGYVLPAMLCLAAGLAPATGAVMRMLPPPIAGPDAKYRHWAAGVVLIPFVALGFAGGTVRTEDAGFQRTDDPLRLWDETVALTPPGPSVYITDSDQSLFAAQYERFVAGARPDVAIAHVDLLRDYWFLHHLDRQLPSLVVPGVDVAPAGHPARQLATLAIAAGVPVLSDDPVLPRPANAFVSTPGRAYQFHLGPLPTTDATPPPLPLDFAPGMGRHVAGMVALTRGKFEAARGRRAAAVRALGLEARIGAERMALLRAPIDDRSPPPLYGLVPAISPVWFYEPWQAELIADDLLWTAGAEPMAGTDAPERQIHAAWRMLLTERLAAGDPALATLGADAELATTRVLILFERWPAAEEQLTSILRRRGKSAELYARLGLVLAKQGRIEQARRALATALELDPDHVPAAKLLHSLGPE